ncbi:c-type cytochrome [Roseateles sp. PN1]|uniref:c-type cytochrome n=1 Tax=Roseateles sp. PN1 TaxID=3137372 RepID=UPI003139FF7E
MKRPLLACLLCAIAALSSPKELSAQEPPAWARHCIYCHSLEEAQAGPAFREIAARYRGIRDPALAAKQLKKSILEGSSGRWGVARMPANVQISEAEAELIAQWLLSLSTP